MAKFFSRLSYSFGNEDWETEHKALRIQPGNRVLCITASGDRPLHLLLADCSEVVSIDGNRIQNYLLDLKKTALQELEYDRYLSFLGATPDGDRNECLESIKKSMDIEARHFWVNHRDVVRKGVLYQGAVERWIRKMTHLTKLFRGEKIKRLFEIDNLDKQREFVRSEWDSFLWRTLFILGLNPMVSRLFLRDPGLYKHIDPSIHVGSYIYQRMNACLMRYLARKNLLISLVLKGVVEKEAFPSYLTQEGSQVIQQRLDRITTKTANVIDYLEEAPEASFDCFSLSDVASYLGKRDFGRLIHAIYRTAKPGARFCIRQFLSNHKIPQEVAPFFCRDSLLEEHLREEDRCFVYRFMVGEITKS